MGARDRDVHARRDLRGWSPTGRPRARRRRTRTRGGRAPAACPRSPPSSRKPSASTRPLRPGRGRPSSARAGGRARSSVSMPRSTVSVPWRVAQRVRPRAIPRRQAASCASRSPSVECRVAHVGADQVVERAHAPAALDQLDRREDQPLLEELGALGALGAREAAADVDVVGDRAGPGDERAVAVERREHLQVGRVRAAHVRVVREDRVARRDVVAPLRAAPPPARTASARAGPGSARSCATMRPSPVKSPQLKSSISRMIGEYEERYSTTAISSAMWWNALARISCVTGSTLSEWTSVRLLAASTSVPGRADAAAPAGRDHHGRVLLLDDRLGPGDVSPCASASRSSRPPLAPAAVRQTRRVPAPRPAGRPRRPPSRCRGSGPARAGAGSTISVSVTVGV